MLTALQILTDRTEYSRFEPPRSMVRARILPAPATALAAESVVVSLKRANGLVMSSQTVVLNGNQSKGTIVTFDLATIVDENNIPICIRGDYYIEAAQGDVKGQSLSFGIAIITVAEMKQDYCFGAPLYNYDGMAARQQPQAVTGVTVTSVSDTTRKGIFGLVYDKSANTLTWGGGPAVTIDGDSQMLPDLRGSYIQVAISSFDLPSGDASEGIVIDREYISDDVIRSTIAEAVDEIEKTVLKAFVEPMRIATEPFWSDPAEGKWYDRKVSELAYYRKDFNHNSLAWHMNLPVSQLVSIDNIQGYMGNTRALAISQGTMAVNRLAGTLDILPYNSEYSYLYTFFVQMTLWGSREYIANFWRYSGVAGVERMEGDILKLIAFTAAIPVLTIAGQGYRGGLASQSTSKDGVSTNNSYTNTASLGIYTATIKEYKEWIDKHQKDIRKRLRGIQMVVI